jgi:hypothetical protein
MRCINAVSRFLRSVVLALPFLGMFAGLHPAHGQVIGGLQYGIVTIHNKTSVTINFASRIGDGAWHQEKLQAGHYRYFYHRYAQGGSRTSPRLHVRFDSDLGPGVTMRGYFLKRKSAAWPNPDYGRHYNFKYSSDGQIDIFSEQ